MAVNAVSRALTILTTLAHTSRPIALGALARQVGLAPSTTHSLLESLVAQEFARNESGAYELGPRAAALGTVAERSAHTALVEAAQAAAETTGHSTIVVSLIGERPVEVVHTDGSDLVTVRRFPITNSPSLDLATGRCLVAYEDQARWPHHIGELPTESANWPSAPWPAVLEATARIGLALRLPSPADGDQGKSRISAVAVPIWRSADARPAWALGCSVPWVMDARQISEVAQTLWDSARQAEHRFGLASSPIARPTIDSVRDLVQIMAAD